MTNCLAHGTSVTMVTSHTRYQSTATPFLAKWITLPVLITCWGIVFPSSPTGYCRYSTSYLHTIRTARRLVMCLRISIRSVQQLYIYNNGDTLTHDWRLTQCCSGCSRARLLRLAGWTVCNGQAWLFSTLHHGHHNFYYYYIIVDPFSLPFAIISYELHVVHLTSINVLYCAMFSPVVVSIYVLFALLRNLTLQDTGRWHHARPFSVYSIVTTLPITDTYYAVCNVNVP